MTEKEGRTARDILSFPSSPPEMAATALDQVPVDPPVLGSIVWVLGPMSTALPVC